MTTAHKRREARALADLSAGTILASVDIAAPPARVFQALTDARDVLRWWGSAETYRTEEWTADVRTGGTWRAVGRSANGAPFVVQGEYLEVDPPSKIVKTWKADWDAGATTTVTYHVDAIDGGTRLTVRHEGFGGRPGACQGHTDGWQLVLGWLDRDLSGAPTPDTRQFFLIRLIAPRPTFLADMTPAEGAIMQEHVGYWIGLMKKGAAVVFGPVADPKGPWGLGVVRVNDEAETRAIEQGDPAIRAQVGFSYEIVPMVRTIVPG